MKKVIVLLIMALAWSGMNAQGFGINVGLNNGSLTRKFVFEETKISQKYSGKWGLMLGAFYDAELTENAYARLGLNFSQYGGKYTDKDGYTDIFSLNYLEFPVLFKYSFEISDNIYAFGIGGPVLGIGLSGKYTYIEDNTSAENSIIFTNTYNNNKDEVLQFKKTNLGFRLGGGFNFNQYEFGLYYTMGLSNITPIKVDEYSKKTGLFSIVFAYRFMN